MAETPEERLARLRREVEFTWTPPHEPDPHAPPDLGMAIPPTPEVPAQPDSSAEPEPAPEPEPANEPAPEPEPAVAPEPAAPAPVAAPSTPLEPAPPTPVVEPIPAPPVEPVPAPAPAPRPTPVPPAEPPPFKPSLRPTTSSGDDGWSLADALGGASLGQWIAVGLLVVGAYLFLAQLFPWIGFPGSLVMTAAGLVLLWQHFGHRAGPWALYAGAILAFIGALRVLGDLMPFNVQGETSLGLGLALLTIAWLRHTQAGGWGWQGIAGTVVLAWGLLQLVLGLFPGAPGVLDLVLPVLLLVGGGWLLMRTLGSRRA